MTQIGIKSRCQERLWAALLGGRWSAGAFLNSALHAAIGLNIADLCLATPISNRLYLHLP